MGTVYCLGKELNLQHNYGLIFNIQTILNKHTSNKEIFIQNLRFIKGWASKNLLFVKLGAK